MLKKMRYGDDALAFRVVSDDFNGIACPAGMNLNERNRDPMRRNIISLFMEHSICHTIIFIMT